MDIASNRWHKMNNIVCEIERSIEKIMIAKDHVAKNKNSVIKTQIDELKSKQDRNYLDLECMCDEWAKSLGGENV